MKKFACLLLMLVVLAGNDLLAQENGKKPIEQIRQYWLVMLTAGKNRTQDSATAVSIQQQHLANIGRLYEAGKIKVAGPFGRNSPWQGLFIFDCETKEEVEKLLQSDAAVSSGRLGYEIYSWWTAPIGSFVPGKPKKE